MTSPDLSVELAPGHKRGLALANPVMTASGTFGYGFDSPFFNVNALGAVVTKSTTLRPRAGNPQTRIAETPAGMLNSIGLQNPGVETVAREYAPRWATWRVPVVVSVLGATADEYAAVAERLEGVEGVAGLELNISSPNARRGGMEFGQDPDAAASVTRAVYRVTTLPVIVKLTPNVTDIVSVARAVVDAGASAVCLINTLQAMAVDARQGRPVIGATFAGLSGPAIKPVGLRMVYQVARAVDAPIIGCGGVMRGEDALEYLEAGATAVQVGTATFANPCAPIEIVRDLSGLLEARGAASIDDVRGLALRGAPGAR